MSRRSFLKNVPYVKGIHNNKEYNYFADSVNSWLNFNIFKNTKMPTIEYVSDCVNNALVLDRTFVADLDEYIIGDKTPVSISSYQLFTFDDIETNESGVVNYNKLVFEVPGIVFYIKDVKKNDELTDDIKKQNLKVYDYVITEINYSADLLEIFKEEIKDQLILPNPYYHFSGKNLWFMQKKETFCPESILDEYGMPRIMIVNQKRKLNMR